MSQKLSLYMESSMALLVTGARTLYESKAFIIHAEFHAQKKTC